MTLPWDKVRDKPYRASVPGLYFHRATEPEKLFGGSVGGTKTTTLATECIYLCMRYPNNRGFVGERDFDDLRRGLYNEILAWLPENCRLADGRDLYTHNKSEHWIRFYNGSEIHFIELKDEPRNVNLGFAAIDQAERVPYSSLNWMRTRLRMPHVDYRPLMLSANPEPGWVKEEYIVDAKPEPTGIRRRNGQELVVQRKGRRLFVPAFPEDNEHLPDGYIEGLYENLPEEMVQRLLEGRWDVVEDAIYDILSRDTHLRERDVTTPLETVALGVDYGEVHPSAVYAVGKDRLGYTWVLEGWSAPSVTEDDFDQLLSNINRMRQKYRVPTNRVYCDPMLKGWDKQYGYTLSDGSAGARKRRIGTVYALLRGQVGRIGEPRRPSMYFDTAGEGVAKAFEQALVYKWEYRETDFVVERVPKRKDDDCIAAIEYAIEALETQPPPIPTRAKGRREPLPQFRRMG